MLQTTTATVGLITDEDDTEYRELTRDPPETDEHPWNGDTTQMHFTGKVKAASEETQVLF